VVNMAGLADRGFMDRKQVYPSSIQPLGSATGYPASGWFSMHITYPDTEYSDEYTNTGTGGWQYGGNTQSWRQGLTVLIKTCMANAGSASVPAQPTSDTTNVVIVDLAAYSVANGGGYNLGSEEATRVIAAKINSQRVRQVGERGQSRYLRARYVNMAGQKEYIGQSFSAPTTTKLRIHFRDLFQNGGPSDLPPKGEFTVATGGALPGDSIDSTHSSAHSPVAGRTYTYDSWQPIRGWGKAESNFTSAYAATLHDLGPAIDLVGVKDKLLGTTMDTTTLIESTGATGTGTRVISELTLKAAPAQHTVVISWEKDNPSVNGGYWAGANGGPIIQGLGQTLPVWHLAAKSLDGGNMGLPALNYDSRGGVAVKHTQNHGFCRFSIEGLNSSLLPSMPPPDFTITEPAISGITAANPALNLLDAGGDPHLMIAKMEYGTQQPTSTDGSQKDIVLYEGKIITESTASSNHLENGEGFDRFTKITAGGGLSAANLNLINNQASSGYVGIAGAKYSQPFFVKRPINTERVEGLTITDEERVFEDIEVIDDSGAKLTLTGGSPFGTVIRDFIVENQSFDAKTGQERVGPSSSNGKATPNLRLQLPSAEDIPGGIFVRSSHDRIQAHSNKTWGMGGMSPPETHDAGHLESTFTSRIATLYGRDVSPAETGDRTVSVNRAIEQGHVSQFDTHDRMLIFHCERLLHPDMASKQGIVTGITPGAVPSGTTRIYSSHRITDHAERGSVLPLTANGTESAYNLPHARLRFGRQGHSFVTPLTHRGTPFAMRRQLHRSHGSAYSLMFEAETENKHTAFQQAKPPTSGASPTKFALDTIELKGVAGYTGATGSFSADGLPLEEATIGYGREYRETVLNAAYGHTHDNQDGRQIDWLIAPGQEHTNVEGWVEQVAFGEPTTDLSVSGISSATSIQFRHPDGNTLTPVTRNRYTTASEMMVNGFMIGDYQLSGGRPEPSMTRLHEHDIGAETYENTQYLVRGSEWGWINPRVATELATVPPLFVHDPDYTNMMNISSPSEWDRGILKEKDTNTGAKPDAFLCHWLAEYAHPAITGSIREHFMMFRYREAGMPRAMQYPATRGLFLRNHSRLDLTEQIERTSYTGTSIFNLLAGTPNPNYRYGQMRPAQKFERIYALQWLQSYGYNGLNAGGHGAGTLKSGSAVIMGNTTVRESKGTMMLPKVYSGLRYSRGEGIGDSINPHKTVFGKYIVQQSGGTTVKHQLYLGLQPMVGFDYGRRLPVRAWGIRTASDSVDMLAGDPMEIELSQQPVYGKGRFDGGQHDSVALAATYPGYMWSNANVTGVERSAPIGFIMSGHTIEATPLIYNSRLSNEPITSFDDEPLGIGRSFGLETAGLFKAIHMPAGMWVDEYNAAHTALNQVPVLPKGGDPAVPSFDETGTGSGSIATVQTAHFGSAWHLVGNALHTNSSDAIATGSFPSSGWGYDSSLTGDILPTPLAEIAEHRQVSSRSEPRMGLIVRTTRDESIERNSDYLITSTKAASLHSDLIVGQQFPITPSHMNRLRTAIKCNTLGTLSAPVTVSNSAHTTAILYAGNPTFSVDNNPLKGPPLATGDTTRINPVQGANDIWNVRGGADLPPWGGVFILRKTYLNRQKTGTLSTANNIYNINAMKASASHPTRTFVDYIVRPFRPSKLYPFAPNSAAFGQDGYTLGPLPIDTGSNTQPSDNFYHRDKRYGIFELNMNKQKGMTEPILSASDRFVIEWPDPNNHDVVYHLIPSTATLEFFKSDANRLNPEGEASPEVEPRYSQSTHPGGFEIVSQSETRYSDSNTNIAGDHAAHQKEDEAVRKQYIDGNRNYNRVEIKQLYTLSGNTYLVVRDASMLPDSGDLTYLGYAGSIHYSAKKGNTLTISVVPNTSPLYASSSLPAGHTWVGKTLYYTRKNFGTSTNTLTIRYPETTGVVEDITASMVKTYPVLPSMIDNAISLAEYQAQSWYKHDGVSAQRTGLSYRGLTSYQPDDFVMLTQRTFEIEDGPNKGIIHANKRGNKLLRDSREITPDFFPPYIFDADGNKWKVDGVKDELGGKFVLFKNMEGESLSDSGFEVGRVYAGQYATIGIRTTDAVMTLLNDASSSSAGFNLKDVSMFESSVSPSSVGGHPCLTDILQHSNNFISRNTRGLNILEVIRNSSQIDGNQLINTASGVLLYSNQIFKETGKRIGADSGARDIVVSRMFDSPNVVAVQGDKVAENESILVEVKDVERMKLQAGAGAEQNVVRSFTQEVPGLKTRKTAIRLAKSLLARIENGAPMIRVMGMVNATSIHPGDVIRIDLSVHGLSGLFAVFETTHNYESGTSDFVIAQYEKGISGILSDLQASIGNASGNQEVINSESVTVALSSSVKVITVHRIVARRNNNTRMTIGHRATATDKKGQIGIRNAINPANKYRALPIGMSKSRPYVVK
jgi:hypothetical protein